MTSNPSYFLSIHFKFSNINMKNYHIIFFPLYDLLYFICIDSSVALQETEKNTQKVPENHCNIHKILFLITMSLMRNFLFVNAKLIQKVVCLLTGNNKDILVEYLYVTSWSQNLHWSLSLRDCQMCFIKLISQPSSMLVNPYCELTC